MPTAIVRHKTARAWSAWGMAFVALGVFRAMDLGLTWHLDPSLQGEQNPLHLFLGGGFLLLLAVNVAVVAFLATLVSRSAKAAAQVRRPAPGLGFAAFLSATFFERDYPWWQILWRTPDRARATFLVGRMAAALTIAVSLLACLGNAGSFLHPAFAQAWAALVGETWRYILTLTACTAIFTVAWLRLEYALYRLRARRLRPFRVVRLVPTHASPS